MVIVTKDDLMETDPDNTEDNKEDNQNKTMTKTTDSPPAENNSRGKKEANQNKTTDPPPPKRRKKEEHKEGDTTSPVIDVDDATKNKVCVLDCYCIALYWCISLVCSGHSGHSGHSTIPRRSLRLRRHRV